MRSKKISNELLSFIKKIQKKEIIFHNEIIKEQPFDSYLYNISKLYKNSRKIYIKNGGQFQPSFISKYRRKYQAKKNNLIEYTPLYSEIKETINNKFKVNFEYLKYLIEISNPIFYEQNLINIKNICKNIKTSDARLIAEYLDTQLQVEILDKENLDINLVFKKKVDQRKLNQFYKKNITDNNFLKVLKEYGIQ